MAQLLLSSCPPRPRSGGRAPSLPRPETFSLSPSHLAAPWREWWLGLSQFPRGWVIYVFYSANSFVQNGYDRLNVTGGGGGACRIPVKPSRPGHTALGDCHCVFSLVGVRKRQWILKGSERAGLSGREIPKTPVSCCPASACLFLLLHPLQAPRSRQTRPSARCRPGGRGLLSVELPRAGRLLGPQSPGPAWLQDTARGTEAFTVAELGLSSVLDAP